MNSTRFPLYQNYFMKFVILAHQVQAQDDSEDSAGTSGAGQSTPRSSVDGDDEDSTNGGNMNNFSDQDESESPSSSNGSTEPSSDPSSSSSSESTSDSGTNNDGILRCLDRGNSIMYSFKMNFICLLLGNCLYFL